MDDRKSAAPGPAVHSKPLKPPAERGLSKHHLLEAFAGGLWCSLRAHLKMLPPGTVLCTLAHPGCHTHTRQTRCRRL